MLLFLISEIICVVLHLRRSNRNALIEERLLGGVALDSSVCRLLLGLRGRLVGTGLHVQVPGIRIRNDRRIEQVIICPIASDHRRGA